MMDMPIQSETLSQAEIAEITGHGRRAGQIAWLQQNGWKHFTNKAGEPIVGRLYTRIMLAGVNPHNLAPQAWQPDFAALGK